MTNSKTKQEIDQFYKRYGEAFAARDLAGVAALCEFPMMLADGDGYRQIEDESFFQSLFDRFDASSWAETRTQGVTTLDLGQDGAVLVMRFTRIRADGTELAADELPFARECCYFLRRRADGLKLVGLADPLPGS